MNKSSDLHVKCTRSKLERGFPNPRRCSDNVLCQSQQHLYNTQKTIKNKPMPRVMHRGEWPMPRTSQAVSEATSKAEFKSSERPKPYASMHAHAHASSEQFMRSYRLCSPGSSSARGDACPYPCHSQTESSQLPSVACPSLHHRSRYVFCRHRSRQLRQ